MSCLIRILSYVGRTPTCVKTCNSQYTISVTWRKERSIVEMNEIMKTVAHRPESWCWHQLLSLLSHILMLVLTQLVCGRPYNVFEDRNILDTQWTPKIRSFITPRFIRISIISNSLKTRGCSCRLHPTETDSNVCGRSIFASWPYE
jgi:hypothetical protein